MTQNPALVTVPDALDRIDPYLPTGNEFVSLPTVSPINASVRGINVLCMQARGMIEFRGEPLFSPFLQVDGHTVPLSEMQATRCKEWLPEYHWEGADGEAEWLVQPDDTVELAQEVRLEPSESLSRAFFIAVGAERDGARTTVVHLRRLGAIALLDATRKWLEEHSVAMPRRVAPPMRSPSLQNLYFAYFFSLGKTIDTEDLVLVTSRSPHRAAEILTDLPLDSGLACESVDPQTGIVRTGRMMASFAGWLGYALHVAGTGEDPIKMPLLFAPHDKVRKTKRAQAR